MVRMQHHHVPCDPPQACGICHSDTTVVLGMRGVNFPAVPGHEVIGRVRVAGGGEKVVRTTVAQISSDKKNIGTTQDLPSRSLTNGIS